MESDSKVAENEVFISTITPLDDFFLEKNDIDIENKVDDWEDKNIRK